MMRNMATILIVAVLALVSLGLVMLMSVSAFVPDNQGDPLFFIVKQSIFLGLGLVACAIAMRWDYHDWIRHVWWIMGACVLLLVLCWMPGIGRKVNGAHRWLFLPGVSLQPAEFVKLGTVAFLAFWLGRHQRKIEGFREGFGKPLCMVMLMCGLVVIQPDLGTTAVLFLITFVLMFTAGTKWYYIAPLPVIGVVGILAVAFFIPERRERILAFMNPEAHESAAAYQIVQGLIALGSGGIQGMGLGNSVQKFYVPEAHTDSIFALLGEELGLICTLSVVLCFLLIALSGGLISYHAPDPTGTLLGLGVTSLICIQAAINIAVVTSLMPAKGMGLPFVSYGGSNLLMSLCCVGILLNIHRQGSYAPITTRRVLPPRATVRM